MVRVQQLPAVVRRKLLRGHQIQAATCSTVQVLLVVAVEQQVLVLQHQFHHRQVYPSTVQQVQGARAA